MDDDLPRYRFELVPSFTFSRGAVWALRIYRTTVSPSTGNLLKGTHIGTLVHEDQNTLIPQLGELIKQEGGMEGVERALTAAKESA
jgi:hypothetical protein